MNKDKISSQIIRQFESELKQNRNPDIKEYRNRYGKSLDDDTRGALVALKALYAAKDSMKLPAGFKDEQRKLARSLCSGQARAFVERDVKPARRSDDSGNVRCFVDLPPPLTREVGPLPILSLAAAGEGQEYIVSEYGLEGITRPFDMAEKDAFGVEVRGDSMAPLITEGSFVATKPSAAPRSGDIALIETTGHRIWVKQVFLKSDKVIMRSFNPAYPDRECARQDILHMYKVIWIRRK